MTKEIVEQYADRVVEDMDLKCMCAFVRDSIVDSLENESEEYINEQIGGVYPDLVEDFGEVEVHVTAQETEQDPNQLNDATYEGYLGDGEYAL